MIIDLIVTVKHFVRYDIYGNPIQGIRYDYDEDIVFTYDMKTLKVKNGQWHKECIPDDVADTIASYFKGTNYHIADIVKALD